MTALTTPPKTRVHCRWGTRRDLPAIAAIEAASYAEPWTADDFERAMRPHNRILMVAEGPGYGPVVGYVLYELHAGYLDLLNLAVDPAYRRQGVGSQMVAKLVGKLASHRREAVTAAVWERDDVGTAFLRACGFRAVGLSRGHYANGDDAYRFRRAGG